MMESLKIRLGFMKVMFLQKSFDSILQSDIQKPVMESISIQIIVKSLYGLLLPTSREIIVHIYHELVVILF